MRVIPWWNFGCSGSSDNWRRSSPGAVVLELGDSSPVLCAQRFGGQGVWGLAQRVRGGTLAPQGQENSGLGAAVLRDRFRSEDSGITNWRSPANAGS